MKTFITKFALFALALGVFLTFNQPARAQSALDGYAFNPPNLTINNLSSNQTANFTDMAMPVQAGDLDPTFVAGVSARGGNVSDVLIQPDGKHLIILDDIYGVMAVNGRGRNGIARLNPDGTIDESFDTGRGFDSTIYAMALQPDGKIIVGGGFGTFTGTNGSTTRQRIARLNPDGSLDTSFGTGADSLVRTISLRSDGKIFIAGHFLSVNGVVRRGTALLNADGSVDPTFNSLSGINVGEFVLATAIQPDGKLVIGGGFTSYGGAARSNIARVNQDGTLDTSFNVGTGATGGRVTTLALQSSGKILIGGDFSAYNNATAVYVARLNTDGSHDTSFVEGGVCTTNPCTNRNLFTSITHISVQSDDTIYMSAKGGTVEFIPGIFGYLARFNSNGVRDTSFAQFGVASPSPATRHAVQSDGKVVTNVYRPFYTQVNGSEVGTHIHRFNTNGTSDNSYNPVIWQTGAVFDIVRQPDGKIIAVGAFHAANAVSGEYIVRFNLDGTVDSTFNAATDGIINRVLLQPDGKILIGGIFFRVNSTNPNVARIARLNADGTLDTSFQGGTSDNVGALALQSDGKILIGGYFTQYNGTTTNRIARLNTDGSLDTTFNIGTGFNGFVLAIAVQPNGQILVGGNFSSYNGTSRQGIARLNSDGTIDSGFNTGTGPNAFIEAIKILPTGKMLIAGDMTTYNNTPQSRIARLNADGSLDTTFSNAPQPTGRVSEFYVQSDGRIIISGVFTSIAGQARNGIARLNADGTLDSTFGNNLIGANPLNTIASIPDTALVVDEPNGIMYYGGRFSTFNNIGRSSLVRLFIGTIPTAASVSISGRVVTPQEFGVTTARVTLTDSQGISRTVLTGKFGGFRFSDVAAGETYILSVSSRLYTYAPQVITPTENITGITFSPADDKTFSSAFAP